MLSMEKSDEGEANAKIDRDSVSDKAGKTSKGKRSMAASDSG